MSGKEYLRDGDDDDDDDDDDDEERTALMGAKRLVWVASDNMISSSGGTGWLRCAVMERHMTGELRGLLGV